MKINSNKISLSPHKEIKKPRNLDLKSSRVSQPLFAKSPSQQQYPPSSDSSAVKLHDHRLVVAQHAAEEGRARIERLYSSDSADVHSNQEQKAEVFNKVNAHRRAVRLGFENILQAKNGEPVEFNQFLIAKPMSSGLIPTLIAPYNQSLYARDYLDSKFGAGVFQGVCEKLTDNFLASPRGGEAMMLNKLTDPEKLVEMQTKHHLTGKAHEKLENEDLTVQQKNAIIDNWSNVDAQNQIFHGRLSQESKEWISISEQPFIVDKQGALSEALDIEPSDAIDIKAGLYWTGAGHAVGGRVSKNPNGEFDVMAFDPNYGLFQTTATNKKNALDDLEKMLTSFAETYSDDVLKKVFAFRADNDDRVDSNILRNQQVRQQTEQNFPPSGFDEDIDMIGNSDFIDSFLADPLNIDPITDSMNYDFRSQSFELDTEQ